MTDPIQPPPGLLDAIAAELGKHRSLRQKPFLHVRCACGPYWMEPDDHDHHLAVIAWETLARELELTEKHSTWPVWGERDWTPRDGRLAADAHAKVRYITGWEPATRLVSP